MYYVQYYDNGVVSNQLIEACGDRAVVILDGRNNINTHHQLAVQMNGVRRPKYLAYRLFQGESFTRSRPISKLTLLQ